MQAKEMNIQGNLKGDGLQNGGLLIVKKGGMEMPLFHVEQVPGDHVTNETILEILGISGDQVNDEYANTLLARSTSYPPLFCPPLSFLLSFPLSFPLSFSYSLSPLPSFCFNVVIFSLFPEFCILQLLRKHWLAVMKMPAV